MSYSVKEIFLTLQGEGAHAGRVAVFCRFAGCNLWSGRKEDRASAVCQFCDTDFVGTDGTFGGKYADAKSLCRVLNGLWPIEQQHRMVVLTGGEPLLQADKPLLEALRAHGFYIAVESNGTIAPPEGIDWLCISPKAGADMRVTRGQELKLVYPQQGCEPSTYEGLDFERFSLQPMDGDDRIANTEKAITYCLANPRWRLSLQTHKIIDIR